LGANHDGGGVGVGPDGKLYWSIGDNGAGISVGDDLTSLAAKVGRANRDGTAPDQITRVDPLVKDMGYQVDIALGPDGALYYVGHFNGRVRRLAYAPKDQGLVVTPLHLWTSERQSMMVNVQLAMAPTSDVTVTVARTGGDADISVSAGATLTFTPANWNVAQTATVAAAADSDTIDDEAIVSVSAPGLATAAVTVHARDEIAAPPPPDDAAVAADGGPDAIVIADAPGADGGEDTAEAGGAPDGGVAPDAGMDVAVIAPDVSGSDLAAFGSDARAAPLDVAPVTDAAAAPPDAGQPVGAVSGCSCRLGGGRPGGGAALALILIAALVRRRAQCATGPSR
jgi:MYXO-CTERM domain-containing protein